MPTVPFTDLGLDESDALSLEQLSGTSLAGTATLLVGSDMGAVFAAAARLAESQLHASGDLDVHHAIASGDKWTLDDIDDRIIKPASLRAFERNLIVVADADRMSSAGFDHLLKTVEEPAGTSHFLLCASSVDMLPATLRGRCSTILTLRPAPAHQRLGLLTEAGASDEFAAELARLSPDNLRLALAAAARPDVIDDLRTYASTPVDTQTPTATADRVLAAIICLTEAMAAAGKAKPARRSSAPTAKASLRPKWDTLTPAQRPDARRLLAALLRRWTTEVIRGAAAVESISGLSAAQRKLEAIADARTELATNAPAATVLPALLARVSR